MMKRRDFVRDTALIAGGIAIGPRILRAGIGSGPAGAAAQFAPTPSIDPFNRELLMAAIDAATGAGAQYADARIELIRNQSVFTREDRVQGINESSSLGMGVRAFYDGSWGFAATQDLTLDAAAGAAASAAAIAKANAKVERAPVRLAPVESYGDVTWSSDYEIDPWDVPIEDKAEMFLELNKVAMAAPNVRFASSGLLSVKVDKTTATSDGTISAQRIVRLSPSMNITAVSSDRTDFQTRGAVVDPSASGYEYVTAHMTAENAERWAAEAAEKLTAVSVESGTWDLVTHPSNLWLTIHESIGHPTELDRALGYEANYAGTSFLAPPEKVIGKTRYGPDHMQIEAERTSSGGMASIGWDDEGVPADRWMIVEDGMFVDYQTTREQVDWISDLTGIKHSHGCSFADSWSSIQFQRMPNMNLLPAEQDIGHDDVIAATDHGIYVESRGSYSIDQQRYNFQFGGQVFWEIKGGKKTRMLKDVAYQANTLDFWNSLDVIGGPSTYYVGGSFYDGKGQPGQVNAVSHGCPTSLFRDVNILNTAR
jgi:TldD protein